MWLHGYIGWSCPSDGTTNQANVRVLKMQKIREMTNPPRLSALVLRKGDCASFWASYPRQANGPANVRRYGNHISFKWPSNMTLLLG